ncbi:MAG TPA: cob(I)yrinic acid a,c-diamide adenosyltransferase, partial [Desulfuromonadaceae bacterium]
QRGARHVRTQKGTAGRDAHPLVIELADTVSEVREIKHAFRNGIEPQPGIDY